MESSTTSPSSVLQLISSLPSFHHLTKLPLTFNFPSSSSSRPWGSITCSVKGRQLKITSVDLSYDKGIPEQIIEKPVGISMDVKQIGDQPVCGHCEAKGVVLCPTCVGSGLYIDSILECQGIIVKVRCLGCGGTGNTMCSECAVVEVTCDLLATSPGYRSLVGFHL